MAWQTKTWHGRPKHGRHKCQMRDKKKMVDGDVCVNAMAFSLLQQRWPPICVNSDGLIEKVIMMASWAHCAHRHSIC
jgi:hypothetical protein